jgi:hypothetical protein
MNLKGWEATIQQIANELSLSAKGSNRHRIMTAWRGKLEKEPNALPLFQIDEIMREVWTRLPAVRP